MSDMLKKLISDLKELEKKISRELSQQQQLFHYKIRDHKIIFDLEILKKHKDLHKKLIPYILNSRILNAFIAPVIYSMIIPALIMDIFVSIYQFICFPVYGIVKVKRADHIMFDRYKLGYLNWIEKFNCCYCSYFNGLASYVQEIAARTEKYWCPIKYASKHANFHDHYKDFFDYGDADSYLSGLAKIRTSVGKENHKNKNDSHS